MKIYAKIKRDGKWNWIMLAGTTLRHQYARDLCECRVCTPAKPNVVSPEEEE